MRKLAFDRSVTGQSNATLAFVFNKSGQGGWGWPKNLSSGKQIGRIANIAEIAKNCQN